MKVACRGSSIDIPLGHTNAALVRSHFDAYEVNLNDSPRATEIMFCLAMTKGPRIHNSMGGKGSKRYLRLRSFEITKLYNFMNVSFIIVLR